MYENAKTTAAQQYNPFMNRAISLGGDVPSPTCEPVSPVGASVNELRLAQNNTHDLITALEQRLSAVLLIVPEKDAASEGKSRAVTRSPLCEELDYRLMSEESAATRLSSLLSRLTV